jgi:hypothetical protein
MTFSETLEVQECRLVTNYRGSSSVGSRFSNKMFPSANLIYYKEVRSQAFNPCSRYFGARKPMAVKHCSSEEDDEWEAALHLPCWYMVVSTTEGITSESWGKCRIGS